MKRTMMVLASVLAAGLPGGCAGGGERKAERKAGAKIIKKEDWDWAEAMRAAAAKGRGKNRKGVVLTLGDSLTYANQSTRWARQGKDQTAADKAVLKWSHAGERESDLNGWWLAAVDRPRGRSETAASGMRTDQYLKGGFRGLPALAKILARYRPQVAFVMLGTNDASAGRKPEEVARDMGGIVDALIARGTVPVLQMLAPMADEKRHKLVREYNKLYLALARKRKVPIIDLHEEFLSRAPKGAWKTQLLCPDGVHFTHKLSAGPPTEENLARCGYLLRCWLAVQKLKEIRKKVFEER